MDLGLASRTREAFGKASHQVLWFATTSVAHGSLIGMVDHHVKNLSRRVLQVTITEMAVA